MIVCGIVCAACSFKMADIHSLQSADVPIRGNVGDHMQIELDIFSGRPNPRWTLTKQQMIDWNHLLQELPEGEANVESPPGLGYRGFIVAPVDASQVECDYVRVYRETITVRHECKRSQFSDWDRTLERFLLHTSQDHIEPRLYEQIEQIIEGR